MLVTTVVVCHQSIATTHCKTLEWCPKNHPPPCPLLCWVATTLRQHHLVPRIPTPPRPLLSRLHCDWLAVCPAIQSMASLPVCSSVVHLSRVASSSCPPARCCLDWRTLTPVHNKILCVWSSSSSLLHHHRRLHSGGRRQRSHHSGVVSPVTFHPVSALAACYQQPSYLM